MLDLPMVACDHCFGSFVRCAIFAEPDAWTRPDRGQADAVLATVKASPGNAEDVASVSRRRALTVAALGVLAPTRVGTEKRF